LEKNRGAGYVVSGIIRGIGIKYFEEYGVLTFLEENTIVLRNETTCHGCIELIHSLVIVLKKLIEPYTTKFLPILKNFYGL